MNKRSILGRLLVTVLALWATTSLAAASDQEPTPREIFEKRIMPIFKSPNASSCTQCHLAGVELKKYIIPSTEGQSDGHEKTFLSLRDQGLIDLKNPDKSKILKFITKREKNAEPNAAMILEKVRDAEFAAFAEWIKECCKDDKLCNAPKLDPADLAKLDREPEVIRYTRKDRLLESFEKNIWAMRFRCASCHAEGDSKQHVDHVARYGARVSWMKKDAETTMNYLIATKHLLNVKNPERSLLILKATGQVPHVGGGKAAAPRPGHSKEIDTGDLGYKGLRTWLEDYAKVVNGEYKDVAGLPRKKEMFNEYGTAIQLSFTNLPADWGKHLLQVNVFAWDDKKQAWETDPIAVTDGIPRLNNGVWAHRMPLNLIALKGSERDRFWKSNGSIRAVPSHRYLVRVYVDKDNRLLKYWKATMTDQDYVGQMELRGELPEEPTPARPERIAELIKQLDNRTFRVRERATIELQKMGVQVAPALLQAFDNPPSAEVKHRAARVLDYLAAGPAVKLDALKVNK